MNPGRYRALDANYVGLHQVRCGLQSAVNVCADCAAKDRSTRPCLKLLTDPTKARAAPHHDVPEKACILLSQLHQLFNSVQLYLRPAAA